MPTREGVDVRLVHGQALCVNATNADIRDVLSRIAEVSGRPIVPARHVRGRVSIDLYGADFFETLEAVLAPLGLRYEEQGDSILVLSAWQVVKR
jgi:type II secretory pathway component HofQ